MLREANHDPLAWTQLPDDTLEEDLVDQLARTAQQVGPAEPMSSDFFPTPDALLRLERALPVEARDECQGTA